MLDFVQSHHSSRRLHGLADHNAFGTFFFSVSLFGPGD